MRGLAHGVEVRRRGLPRGDAAGRGRRGRAGVSTVTLAGLEQTRRRAEAAQPCGRRGRKGERQGEAEGAGVRGAGVHLAGQVWGAAAEAGWPAWVWMGEELPGSIRGYLRLRGQRTRWKVDSVDIGANSLEG